MPPQSVMLTVSYALQPPPHTSAPANLSSVTKHEFTHQLNLPSETDSNVEAYYAALRDAIAQAKNVTGQELTEWRDAVGDGEKEKTGGKAELEEDGGEEEVDADDEEQ